MGIPEWEEIAIPLTLRSPYVEGRITGLVDVSADASQL